MESTAAAVETSSSSTRVEHSQVSSVIKEPCVSPGISVQTITTYQALQDVRETEETGDRRSDRSRRLESVGGEGAFGDGEDTDSDVSAGDTATTLKPSQ